MSQELARARQEEWLRRAAQRHLAASVAADRSRGRFGSALRRLGLRRSSSTPPTLDRTAEIRIRAASAEETIVLGQLPAPGDSPVSTATVLMAEVDGARAAALSPRERRFARGTEPDAAAQRGGDQCS